MRYTVEGPTERLIIHSEENLGDAVFNTNCGTITLDPFVFFGHKVMILTGSHDPLGIVTGKQIGRAHV